MPPQFLKYTYTAGDTIPFSWGATVDGAGNSVSSFSGWHFRFEVKDSDAAESDVPILTFLDTDDPCLFTIASTTISWKVTGSNSALLCAGKEYDFRLVVTTPAGDVTTIQRGRLYPQPPLSTPV